MNSNTSDSNRIPLLLIAAVIFAITSCVSSGSGTNYMDVMEEQELQFRFNQRIVF